MLWQGASRPGTRTVLRQLRRRCLAQLSTSTRSIPAPPACREVTPREWWDPRRRRLCPERDQPVGVVRTPGPVDLPRELSDAIRTPLLNGCAHSCALLAKDPPDCFSGNELHG